MIVKFAEVATRDCTSSMIDSSGYDAALNKVAEEGILVGLRRYQFFGKVFCHDPESISEAS